MTEEINVCHVGDLAKALSLARLALCREGSTVFDREIEEVLHRILVSVRDDEYIGYACLDSLFNEVIYGRKVNNR